MKRHIVTEMLASFLMFPTNLVQVIIYVTALAHVLKNMSNIVMFNYL